MGGGVFQPPRTQSLIQAARDDGQNHSLAMVQLSFERLIPTSG